MDNFEYHPYCMTVHDRRISCWAAANGKKYEDRKRGRTFTNSRGDLGCAECCNGDRCDDPSCYDRDSCPFCLGSGSVPE